MRESLHHSHLFAPVITLGLDHALESWSGLIDRLPIGVAVFDHAGMLVQYNRRAAEIWGRSPALGAGRTTYCGAARVVRTNGPSSAHGEFPIREVLRTGQPVRDRELIIERPDGHRITILANADPLIDSAGAIIGAVNCFQDITEHQRNEERRRNDDRRLRQLVDALPVAIYTTDTEGHITFYNQAAVTLSGREPEIGSDRWCVSWRLLSSDGSPLPHDQCPMAIAVKENRPVRGVEAIVERADGTRVPFLAYPTPLRDDTGAMIGAVNMMVDISGRKQAEGRQKILLNELNHRVKNNMQMLHALLKIAQRETGNAEARIVMSEAAQRVAAMAAAQQMLYDADDPVNFDAGRFLIAVCANVKQSLDKHIDIAFDALPGGLPNDCAIPLALILNELLTNAVKHGRSGEMGAPIRVGLKKEGASIVLYVEDRGPGFILSDTRKRSSGLGLVVGLARQMGGDFEVTRNRGARCAVRIPEHRSAN